MADLTYSSKGTFDSNGIITVEIAIPTDNPNNRYEFFHDYNISKIVSGGIQINAVFMHMKLTTDPGDVLNSPTFEVKRTINANRLTSYDKLVPFDATLKESLFLVFHDDTFGIDDVTTVYNNIENLFIMVKSGITSIDIDELFNGFPIRPRKLGLGIIVKR
jgi:hypothetical protein